MAANCTNLLNQFYKRIEMSGVGELEEGEYRVASSDVFSHF